MTEIVNHDSRRIQPLPWTPDIREAGKCITLESINRKAICSFWGSAMRHPENYAWCTEEQMIAHAHYTAHVCNHFPHIQAEIERIYAMEDMPEEAIKTIEVLMEKIYLNTMEMPPYATPSRQAR